MNRPLFLFSACALALSLLASDARADAMCGGARKNPDPPPPSSSVPRTQPVGALDAAPAPVDHGGPRAPVEVGMLAGMVLLGGGAAASSRGKKKS